MAGGVVLSGPGEACVDALRCAAFLVRQHPQELKEALDSMNASRSTSREGGEGDGVWWLEGLVGALQGLVGQASGPSRRRKRRKKKRRKEQAGQAEGQEEFEDEESTATEDEEDEEGEASGGAWRAGGRGGGQGARAQQLQQGSAAAAASSQPTEQPGGMEVDPAASVSVPVRPRADLAMTRSDSSSSSSSRRAGGAVRRVAVAEALSLADVVGSIFSFLVGVGEASTGRQSVRQLGQLGLVCRKWREVSLWEAWWVAAAEEMLPVSVWGGRDRAVARMRVLEHGRMLWRERRVWCGKKEWRRGLSLHFEVFDRMDGLQMLSARGPLYATFVPNEHCITLKIGPGRRWEVVGRPFSAASRDPEQRRFESMEDFFERSHEEEFASSVCVRVSVTDERTGRRALLWEEEGKHVERDVTDVDEGLQEFVGAEALDVGSLGALPVACPSYSGPQLEGFLRFVVQPVAGQAEGVSEQERLWQLAGGDEQNYDQHGSFVKLCIRACEAGVEVGNLKRMVRGFVRSLLDVGHH